VAHRSCNSVMLLYFSFVLLMILLLLGDGAGDAATWYTIGGKAHVQAEAWLCTISTSHLRMKRKVLSRLGSTLLHL
jgi:hypothetical protein